MQFHRIALFSGIGIAASVLAACSGGSSNPPHVTPTATPTASAGPTATPVLVTGSVAQYTGTDVTAHVYKSPTPTQTNFSLGYSFTKTNTFQATTSGAPAPYNLSSTIVYTPLQAMTTGTLRQTETTNQYESQTISGATDTLAIVGTSSTTVGTDLTAGNHGPGPYTVTVNGNTTYTSPRLIGVYPLTAGFTNTQNIARTIATTSSDTNAGGAMPAAPYNASSSQTFAQDGSYMQTFNLTNGEKEVLTENSNGSFAENETGPIFDLAVTIGTPVSGASGSTIPLTFMRTDQTTGATPAPAPSTMPYTAADWYPGGGAAPSPLTKDVLTVKGPVSTLPSACSAAPAEPNVVEVDDTQTSLDVFAGTYATQVTQRFDSNGTIVCIVRVTTTNLYMIDTGVNSQTETETFTQVLSKLTLASSARGSAPAR